MESIDAADIEALLKVSGLGPRALIAAATNLIVGRMGDRGACVLLGSSAHVVYSTDFPSQLDFPLDLRRYPEISAAVDSSDVLVIEDVKASSLLHQVTELLPAHLGAVAVVPLVAQERCFGVISVRSAAAARRSVSPEEVAAARLLGRMIGTLLDLQCGAELLQQLGCAPGVPMPQTGETRTLQSAPVVEGVPERLRRRVLIADDNTDDAAWLAELLGDEGFDVSCAQNGAEAAEQARQTVPDLILLDVHMPVMDGFTAASELTRDPRTASIPILFLSASEDLLCRVRNLDRDGVDFLRKPCSFLELLARIEKSLRQAESKNHLRLDANIDELTGLGNLRCLREHCEKEESRMGRIGSSLAVVMIDVDKLKQINDRHGHMVGSRVLRSLGETLRSEIRPTDVAIRYGGDEFVVLLPHAVLDEGVAFATRVLARINALRPEGIDITVSMGVAAFDRSGGISIDAVLAHADAAAYRAKRLGGNRVCKHQNEADVVVDVSPSSPASAPHLDA